MKITKQELEQLIKETIFANIGEPLDKLIEPYESELVAAVKDRPGVLTMSLWRVIRKVAKDSYDKGRTDSAVADLASRPFRR